MLCATAVLVAGAGIAACASDTDPVPGTDPDPSGGGSDTGADPGNTMVPGDDDLTGGGDSTVGGSDPGAAGSSGDIDGGDTEGADSGGGDRDGSDMAGGDTGGGDMVGGDSDGGDSGGGDDPLGGADNGDPPAVDPNDLSVYKDPGTDPWELVPDDRLAEECGMDPTLVSDLSLGTAFAVSRYGKLCAAAGGDGTGRMWSATKTLGALVTGLASYATREVERTGPMTGQLQDSDLATHWLGRVSYNSDATLAHVMGMIGHNSDLSNATYSYDTVGAVQINSLSTMVSTAIGQVPGLGSSTGGFARSQMFDKLGMTSSSWGGTIYAYSWTANTKDMLRMGLLINHMGVYNGERLMSRDWAYKMTHPSFENSNKAYGYLTWLEAKEGGTGPGGGGSFTSSNQGDPCSPAAVWPADAFPHGESEATDCGYTNNSCDQTHDVGIWSAQGALGQFVVGHRGLDMVIAARNYSGQGGPAGLWAAIRPALVAMDPMFQGDEDAFCEAYGAGDYAPDLPAPIIAPR